MGDSGADEWSWSRGPWTARSASKKRSARSRSSSNDKLRGNIFKAAQLKLKHLIEDANAYRRTLPRPRRTAADAGDFELTNDLDVDGENGQYWTKAVIYVNEKEIE